MHLHSLKYLVTMRMQSKLITILIDKFTSQRYDTDHICQKHIDNMLNVNMSYMCTLCIDNVCLKKKLNYLLKK